MNVNIELKTVDIRTIDKSTLTDIKDVKISTEQPVNKRIASFIKQVSNPYCILVDGVAVKFAYADTKDTMSDKMREYFRCKAE